MMRKILNPMMSVLIAAVFVFSAVFCCCTATALMTHIQKPAVMCSHCQGEHPQSKSSVPAGACPQQLTSAIVLHSHTIIGSFETSIHYPTPAFLNHYHNIFSLTLISVYPPGGPPLGFRFTPLYLRTFNLRI